MYDPSTNKWETKVNMPIGLENFISLVIDGKIYCIGGFGEDINGRGESKDEVKAYIAYIPPTEEDIAEEATSKAEQSKDPVDIEDARDLVNRLPDSSKKDELNDRLNAIFPNIEISKQTVSKNTDIYIKMANTLSLSLDTNAVIFEDFSGVEDMEKVNAINLAVESSLPYEINASLETEIQNADGTEIIDKLILNIKANIENDYKSFTSIGAPIVLLDNQQACVINTHGIDLKLNKNIISKADVYKATIKFEAKQK